MNKVLDESLSLSRPLASAISVQKIGEIAADNVRRECGGELPVVEAAMIEAFEGGLRDQRLVLKGPLEASSVGHLLIHLTDLDDDEDVRTFYEEADACVGGPTWELLSDGERASLLKEAMSLANSVRPIWERHCDATPDKYA
jgi:hypothetical protein